MMVPAGGTPKQFVPTTETPGAGQHANHAAGLISKTSVDLTGSSMSSASLTVPSTQASGQQVTISHAVVTAPTWIIVYDNHSGTPGNALGAALFFPTSMGGVER